MYFTHYDGKCKANSKYKVTLLAYSGENFIKYPFYCYNITLKSKQNAICKCFMKLTPSLIGKINEQGSVCQSHSHDLNDFHALQTNV